MNATATIPRSHVAAEPAEPTDTDQPEPQRLVLEHLDLARKMASRYAARGEDINELVQVARLGLVLAANRFDPQYGTYFSSFAIPTILGELRKHFRDRCWTVHVPRPLHDLYQQANKAQERLTARLGRSCTTTELAAELEVSAEELLEALESGRAYSASSLDMATAPDSRHSLAETIGEDSEYGPYDVVEDRESVRQAISQLPEREAHALYLRFFQEQTQTQIAEELGVSQMHVSRLLTTTLQQLRAAANDGTPVSLPAPRSSSAS